MAIRCTSWILLRTYNLKYLYDVLVYIVILLLNVWHKADYDPYFKIPTFGIKKKEKLSQVKKNTILLTQ